MDHYLIEAQMIAQSPDGFLQSTGQVFAVFDERTQDSGNATEDTRDERTRFNLYIDNYLYSL